MPRNETLGDGILIMTEGAQIIVLAHGEDVLFLFAGIVGGANLLALSSVFIGWFAWRSKSYSRGAFMLAVAALVCGIWLSWLLGWDFQKDLWTFAILALFPLSLTGIILSFWNRCRH